jgi:predicted transcriptional regulator
MSNESRTFDENEVYDVLRNERRRRLLRSLEDAEAEQTIGDLADRIAAAEAGESEPPADVRQSVYVSLHQTHLPKLHDLGVLNYDRDDRTVRLLPPAEEVLIRLDAAESTVDADRVAILARVTLVAAVLGMIAALGGLAGIPGLAALNPAVYAVVALAVVLVAGALLVDQTR